MLSISSAMTPSTRAAFSTKSSRCIASTISAPRWAARCASPSCTTARTGHSSSASYEGFRNRVGGATTVVGLPPPEFYQGDFRNAVSRTQNKDGSYLLYKLYDPSTTRYD